MTGIALILQHMVASGQPLAALAAGLPRYEIVKEKFPFAGDFEALTNRLRQTFGGEYNMLDGIRIDTDGGWVHVRRSNTEPVVRIIAEAPTEDEAQGLVRNAAALLED
jgi:phosphomannomutase